MHKGLDRIDPWTDRQENTLHTNCATARFGTGIPAFMAAHQMRIGLSLAVF